tara:strand:+ start:120124 stop:120975 length:852 start_codon:yes stop_codon:yes gene_type:complete
MTTQAAGDLIWTINSPSLIRLPTGNGSSSWPVCRESDFDPEELHTWCESHRQYRVGRYFEDLIHFYLLSVRSFEIVEQGLQIEENGRTIGELDFLYRNQNGELCHCETAVKFFLHTPESNDSGSHFIGPNSADNFEKKTQRLFEHQLRLSEVRFPDVSHREAFVKGRIFYHPLTPAPTILPELLARDHLKGSWIRESELELLGLSDSNARFRVARKPHWLAPEQAALADETLLTVDGIRLQLENHFTKKRTPQLVTVLSKNKEQWQESDRVFVVSDQWPHNVS